MARYIKREALPKEKERGLFSEDYFNVGWNACLNNIESIPDADVRPVVRGKWKLNSDGSGTCSVCHYTQSSVWDDDGWQSFCGHCGADMRKEAAERKIVHCRECRSYFKNSDQGYCKEHTKWMFPWEYCSRGKRKEKTDEIH